MRIISFALILGIITCLAAACNRGDMDPAIVCPAEEPERGYLLPDAFSPNGDGTNDRLRIVEGAMTADLQSVQLGIYDASDNQLGSINGLAGSWDGTDQRTGKPAPAGRYRVVFCVISRRDTDSFALAADGELAITLFRDGKDGCLKGNGCSPDRYTFADQIDPATGMRTYNTVERFCN